MSFLLGSPKAKQAQQQPSYTGLDLQTSVSGKAIAIAFGTVRLAPNIIWYGEFQAYKHESSAAGGGKGGGGGTSSSVSYTYSASVCMGLCHGPINGISTVWVGKAKKTLAQLGMSLYGGIFPQPPWGYLSAKHGNIADSWAIPKTAPYTVIASHASTFEGDQGVTVAQSIAMVATGGLPAPGQYRFAGSVYQFNAANAGQPVVISLVSAQTGLIRSQATSFPTTIPTQAPYTIAPPYHILADKGVICTSHSLTAVAGTPEPEQYAVDAYGTYTFNAANAGQKIILRYAAWAVDTQALPYNGIAYVAVPNLDLGDNPSLSNFNFETQALWSESVPGSPEADPSLVVTTMLSDPLIGVGFPSAMVGDLSTYRTYALAASLLVSFTLDEQQSATQVLADLMKATNSEFVWSQGVLSIVPYGDQAITGNGVTYAPPTEPLFDLTDDDFMLENQGDDPVVLTRKRASDAYNCIQVEYLDRSNDYNTDIAEAKDQAAIDQFGLRQQSGSGTHIFADGSIAQLSAQLQLQRALISNQYAFTLDERFIVLDPMDIVSLTDPALGLDKQWVRILQIEQNDDGSLNFTAEEYLAGTGHAPAYAYQTGSGYISDYNVDPGNANAPVIFEAPVQIATTSGLEVWMAISGGPSFGGADVYISADGESYKYVGRSTGNCRQGLLTAELPPGIDPDLLNFLSIDLSESRGEILSGTQDDADLGHTLCYVDGELVAYQNATLIDANQYALTYLRRGMYGTAIADHAAGAQFARMDDGKFVYSYDKSQIGQTIYVKLLAFNLYMGGNQTLTDVNPYTHVIQGPPVPPIVARFSALQSGGAVVFRWAEVADYALKGYDILYGPQNRGIEAAKFLTESARGTEMTNASVPPGAWTFYIQARDIADQVSPQASTCDLVVSNANEIIQAASQAPDWLGTLDGFVKHWTGVLVPMGTKTCDEYAVLAAPAAPLLVTVPGGALPDRTYFVQVTYATASGETTASPLSSIDVAAGALLSVASPAPSGDAASWNLYVGTAADDVSRQDPSPVQIGAGWTEPTTGLVTGAPQPAMNTTGWETFNVAVPDPVATASYTAPTIDTGFVSTFRIWASQTVRLLPTDTGIPSVAFQVSASAGEAGDRVADDDTLIVADDGSQMETDGGQTFTDFESGLVTAQYVTGRLQAAITAGSVPCITGFTPTIDIEASTQTLTAVAVDAAGTWVPYPQQCHNLPNVQVTASGPGVTSGAAVGETTSGTWVFVYNGSTPVTGNANITITGV